MPNTQNGRHDSDSIRDSTQLIKGQKAPHGPPYSSDQSIWHGISLDPDKSQDTYFTETMESGLVADLGKMERRPRQVSSKMIPWVCWEALAIIQMDEARQLGLGEADLSNMDVMMRVRKRRTLAARICWVGAGAIYCSEEFQLARTQTRYRSPKVQYRYFGETLGELSSGALMFYEPCMDILGEIQTVYHVSSSLASALCFVVGFGQAASPHWEELGWPRGFRDDCKTEFHERFHPYMMGVQGLAWQYGDGKRSYR